MTVAAIGAAPVFNSVSQGKRATLTEFSGVQVGGSPLPTFQKELQLHEKPSNVPRFETRLVPIQRGLRARVLTRVETVTLQPSFVTSLSGFVETGAAIHSSHVMIKNVRDEPPTIHKSTFIGIPEPVPNSGETSKVGRTVRSRIVNSTP